ncbi:hypothetical protein [Actinoplanes sp. NPDC049265]|uniref:hypothetical protein n=1 Tax=Actinoplanes sp. NPDC049265 TaxID=3363902 RepID=UPI003710740C
MRIRLADLGAVRWPVSPMVGTGELVAVALPMPRLAWTRTATVELPLGSDAAERIAAVTRLRKVIEYAVIPAILALFVLAAVFMVLDWTRGVAGGRTVAGVLGLVAFALVFLSLLPSVVVIASKLPRVVGREVWLPAANESVAGEAAALNPPGMIRVEPNR